MRNPCGVRALGQLDDKAKCRELERADVLCAPALGGESFGVVLTEAFAAGTPVVASNIAGYREVVCDGADGVLVPAGGARALARRAARPVGTVRAARAHEPCRPGRRRPVRVAAGHRRGPGRLPRGGRDMASFMTRNRAVARRRACRSVGAACGAARGQPRPGPNARLPRGRLAPQ